MQTLTLRKPLVEGLFWNGSGDEVNGLPEINFREVSDGVLEASSMATPSLDLRIMKLAAGKEFNATGKVMVSLIRGTLSSPFVATRPMEARESGYYSTTTIKATQESLLCVCYVREIADAHREQLAAPFSWKQINSCVSRSDPKIMIDKDVRLNYWWIEPNTNGGIHNHSKDPTDHNVTDINMQEWHLLLSGGGFMVKYHTQDPQSEYSRFEMQLGQFHPPFYRKTRDGETVYPYHAWEAGPEGSLFIAFEDLKDL